MRVNAALEAQAAALISEADAVLRHREEVLMSPNASVDLELSFDDEQAQDSELLAGTVSAYRDILGANIGGSNPASPARPASSRGRSSTSPTRGPRTVPSGEPDAVDEFISALSEVDNETAARLLKAQLRAMQDELTGAQSELKATSAEAKKLAAQTKALTADNTKLQRTAQAAQDAVDRLRGSSEDSSRELQTASTQARSLKKEVDELRRTQKQVESKNSTLQVRLNRAQEELESSKRTVSRSRQSNSDTGDEMRRQLEATTAQNKLLTAQRKELLDAFKKQLQLIDILKRQKMHVEAARVLQFSEEEFVRALDWGADK